MVEDCSRAAEAAAAAVAKINKQTETKPKYQMANATTT